MRLILLLFAALLLLFLLPALVLLLTLQDSPSVTAEYRLTQHNVARIKQVLKDADPRWLQVGDHRRVNLIEDDLNLVLNYGLSHFREGVIAVRLHDREAHVAFSLKAPAPFESQYFNTQFMVSEDASGFRPSDWHLGDIAIPDPLARFVAQQGHALLLVWPP